MHPLCVSDRAVTLTGSGFKADASRFADVTVYFVIALLLFGMLAFGFRRGGDISTPYVQSFRLIVKNSVLWVMFLASMGASVFFSFDSHFNAIFPADSRKRAAEIRTTNQIGAVVADIGAVTQKRQIEEAERLFETDGWKAYDRQLASLDHAAQGAQSEIEQYFVQQMEERRRAIAQQQERIATAHGVTVGVIAHAGDGNLHPNIVVDRADPSSVAAGQRVFDEIMELALRMGGTSTGEHGVGLLKREWLARELGPVGMRVHRAIKRALDPNNLLNPGKVL